MTAAPARPSPFTRAELLVIVAAGLSMLIVQMDWFALNLALPVIARDFGVPTTDLQWVVSGYMLTIGALMVAGGRLADLFGRRRTMVVGLLVFAAVSALCGAAEDETWLIAARAAQGVGAALVFPVAIAVVAATFPDARQARAIGTVLAFSAVGTALGPFVGGVFAEHVSWRAVFFVNVPFCLVAAALMLRYVREGRDEAAERHIDFPGMAALSAALVAIAYGFDKGEAWGWTSVETLSTILGGVALLGLFVVVEQRVRSPLVDLSLFRNRPYVAVVAAGSLSNVVYCFLAVFSALYLQQARGLSPLDAGLVFLALSGGAGAAAYFSGRLAERFPADRLMAAGLLTSAAFITLLTFSDSLWAYTPVFFVCGIGVGLGWALTNVATQAVVRPQQAGVASGVALTSLVMLGAVGVAIGATALDLIAGSAEAAGRDAAALDALLRVAAGLAFAGAIVLLGFVRGRAQPDEIRVGAAA